MPLSWGRASAAECFPVWLTPWVKFPALGVVGDAFLFAFKGALSREGTAGTFLPQDSFRSRH